MALYIRPCFDRILPDLTFLGANWRFMPVIGMHSLRIMLKLTQAKTQVAWRSLSKSPIFQPFWRENALFYVIFDPLTPHPLFYLSFVSGGTNGTKMRRSPTKMLRGLTPPGTSASKLDWKKFHRISHNICPTEYPWNRYQKYSTHLVQLIFSEFWLKNSETFLTTVRFLEKHLINNRG